MTITELASYLEENGITQRDAAEQLGVTRSYINNLTCGRQTPGLRLALEIEAWSGGAVTVGGWARLLPGARVA